MTDDYERCGRTGRQSGEPCDLPAGWGTDHVGEGACKHHGGASSGAPEGNGNAITHGAQSDPHNLREHLDGEDEAWIDALTEAYLAESAYDEDDPQAERIEMTVVMAWQERSGRAQLIKEGLERRKIVSAAEGGLVKDDAEHHLNDVVASLNSDIRMNLKDLGLLEDPQSQTADALGDLKEGWAGDLRS